MNPIDLYKNVEKQYKEYCKENNETFNTNRHFSISQWCNVKDQLHEYLPYTRNSLDAGCGEHKRGEYGFDLRDGMSYRNALSVWPENRFEVVTSYGSVHSALNSERSEWNDAKERCVGLDPDVLTVDNPLIGIQRYAVDRNLIAFHASCLAYWSKDYVGITIRSRHCDENYLNKLAKIFNCKQTEVFKPNTEMYTNNLIKYFNDNKTTTEHEQLDLLTKLYVVRNIYVNDPPVGVVWRKIND